MEKSIQKQQNQSVTNTAISDTKTITASVVVAFERVNVIKGDCNIGNMVMDIQSTFPKLETLQITKAIKMGSMGKYGTSYRFSTQEIGKWIFEWCKQNSIDPITGKRIYKYAD